MINTFNCHERKTVITVNYLFNFKIMQSNDFYVSFLRSVTSDLKRSKRFRYILLLLAFLFSMKFSLRTINFRIFQVCVNLITNFNLRNPIKNSIIYFIPYKLTSRAKLKRLLYVRVFIWYFSHFWHFLSLHNTWQKFLSVLRLP